MRVEDGAVDIKQSHCRREVEQAGADEHQDARLRYGRAAGQSVVAIEEDHISQVILLIDRRSNKYTYL